MFRPAPGDETFAMAGEITPAWNGLRACTLTGSLDDPGARRVRGDEIVTTIGKIAGFAAVAAALYGTTFFTRDRANPAWSTGLRPTVASAPAGTAAPAPAAITTAAVEPAAVMASPAPEPAKVAAVRDPDSTGSLPKTPEPIAEAKGPEAADQAAATQAPMATQERRQPVKRAQQPTKRVAGAADRPVIAPASVERPATAVRIQDPIQFRLAERG